MKVQFLIVFFLAAVRCLEIESVLDLFPEFKELKAKIDTRAFLSAWVPHSKTMSPNEIIPFTTIIDKHGISSVSSMTSRGIFTCEKTGYYFVSFFVTSNSPRAAASLYKTRTLYNISYTIARAMKSGDDDYESHAAMTITQLDKGDILSVKADNNGMNVYNTYDSGFTILQIN